MRSRRTVALGSVGSGRTGSRGSLRAASGPFDAIGGTSAADPLNRARQRRQGETVAVGVASGVFKKYAASIPGIEYVAPFWNAGPALAPFRRVRASGSVMVSASAPMFTNTQPFSNWRRRTFPERVKVATGAPSWSVCSVVKLSAIAGPSVSRPNHLNWTYVYPGTSLM